MLVSTHKMGSLAVAQQHETCKMLVLALEMCLTIYIRKNIYILTISNLHSNIYIIQYSGLQRCLAVF